VRWTPLVFDERRNSVDRRSTLHICQIERLSIGVNAMAGSKTSAKAAKKTKSASAAASGDWRSQMLARIRSIITEADPDAVEEVKWRKPSNPAGVPVWSHAGIICTGERYKTHVKLTFANGAALADPGRLFNSSLEGAMRRGIDIHEGDKINEKALKALVRSAAALNMAKQRKARPGAPKKKAKPAAS
jgi:hypothetical protein